MAIIRIAKISELPERAARIAPLLLLAACGGGGGGNGAGGTGNNAPSANAGPDFTVFESTSVNLNGSGSDPDGDTLSFTWSQSSGQAVTINNPNQAAATFTSPDVAAGAPETLQFRLDVNDGAITRGDIVNVRVEENEPPVANAGPDSSACEASIVTLDGTGSSDPNTIGTLSYSWTQIGGQAVTLSGSDTAEPTFTAPDVPTGQSEVLTFELTVSDGVSNDVDTVAITVEEGQPFVTISGTVSYEFVPPFPNCNGLNFALTTVKPIRQATVQLIDATTGNVIDSTVSDDLGGYQFTNIAALTDVRLRVRAELKRGGTPSWDVEVRDNVNGSPSPPPLTARPLYVLDGSDFNTGGADQTRNLTATTGWDGLGYSGPRAAAPFAILDAIYSGMRLVLSADPSANFAALDAFWSVNNTLVQGGRDIDNGELGASFYSGNPDGGLPNPSLFLLGDANVDTEEFDDHVVVHEWGHYFEDNFSRSDSIGGPHALGQSLDARLAFGEGWATALAAMALDNPLYCDTGRAGQPEGFGINTESGGFGVQGWFNEVSVATLLYDLYDTNDDGTDDSSIGFQPIFETMVGPQLNSEAFTSIFSFAAELKPMLAPPDQAFVDSQLTRENINPVGIDIWGSTETNDAGGRDVLPVYINMVADGSVLPICTNSDFEFQNGDPPAPERTGNKLAEDRYIRLTVPATDTYDVRMATTTPLPPDDINDSRDQSDPDIYIYLNGQLVESGTSPTPNFEIFTTQSALSAGEVYSVYVEEWRFDDPATPREYPDQICFDVSFTATP